MGSLLDKPVTEKHTATGKSYAPANVGLPPPSSSPSSDGPDVLDAVAVAASASVADGVVGCGVSSPPDLGGGLVALPKNAVPPGGLSFGVSGMQGWRVDMEDAHVLEGALDPSLEGHSLFGVFDGHGG